MEADSGFWTTGVEEVDQKRLEFGDEKTLYEDERSHRS